MRARVRVSLRLWVRVRVRVPNPSPSPTPWPGGTLLGGALELRGAPLHLALHRRLHRAHLLALRLRLLRRRRALLLEGRGGTLGVARALCRVARALLLQHGLPARHLGEQPVLGVLAARLPPLQLSERAVELALGVRLGLGWGKGMGVGIGIGTGGRS